MKVKLREVKWSQGVGAQKVKPGGRKNTHTGRCQVPPQKVKNNHFFLIKTLLTDCIIGMYG